MEPGEAKKQYLGIFSVVLRAPVKQASVCPLTSFQSYYPISCILRLPQYFIDLSLASSLSFLLASVNPRIFPSHHHSEPLCLEFGNLHSVCCQSGDHLLPTVVPMSQMNYESFGLVFSTTPAGYPQHPWKIPVARLLVSMSLLSDKLISALTSPWTQSLWSLGNLGFITQA